MIFRCVATQDELDEIGVSEFDLANMIIEDLDDEKYSGFNVEVIVE